MNELLDNYQHVITDFKLIPSGGGVFELIVNDDLVYSKKATKRHVEEGELLQTLTDIVGPDVPRFHDTD